MSEAIKKNRLILLVLSVLLGLCMVWAFSAQTTYAKDKDSAEVSAQYEEESSTIINGVEYLIRSDNPNEAMVYDWYTGIPSNVVIPERVTINNKSYPVTEIDMWSFDNCKTLTSVSIPVTMQKIENGAFCGTGLTKVIIPYSVTIIEDYAFGYNEDASGYSKVPGFTIEAAFGSAGFNYGKRNGFITYDPSVMSVTVDQSYVNADIIAAAIDAAGGKREYITNLTLGKNVKKLDKGSLAPFQTIKMIQVQTKKLKKKGVKASLKGSAVKTIKVQVGKKKANKKFVKKYKKIFTKKNCGKKVKVKR